MHALKALCCGMLVLLIGVGGVSGVAQSPGPTERRPSEYVVRFVPAAKDANYGSFTMILPNRWKTSGEIGATSFVTSNAVFKAAAREELMIFYCVKVEKKFSEMLQVETPAKFYKPVKDLSLQECGAF